jgi:pyridoxamine 5'-phosphate oxidase
MAAPFDHMRIDYRSSPLDREDLDEDPLLQFGRWLGDADAAGVEEPNAFVLATTNGAGRPSARTVLLKAMDPAGFTFYTNYRSPKANDLEANPRAAAVFLWVPLRRQVRIEGSVTKVDDETSDAYFASRPPEARLASAASPQSQVVADRAELDALLEPFRERYPDGNVPRPKHWGGYRINPEIYEFWQGREARFHDRFRYTLAEGGWVIERLAP